MFLGLDPGITGGIAVLDKDGLILALSRFDGLKSSDVIRSLLSDLGCAEILCALESVHARPGQDISSMFNFGREFGRIQGFLDAHLIDYTLYSPQAWQKYLPKSDTAKGRVRAWVDATYGPDPFIFERCRVPHSGCMDAAAIADYHRRVKLQLISAPKPASKTKKKRVLRF